MKLSSASNQSFPLDLFQNGGKLKLHKNGVVFKNNKTGKVEQLNSSDLASVKWMKVAFGYEVKFILTSGAQFKFEGFKESVRKYIIHKQVSCGDNLHE